MSVDNGAYKSTSFMTGHTMALCVGIYTSDMSEQITKVLTVQPMAMIVMLNMQNVAQ